MENLQFLLDQAGPDFESLKESIIESSNILELEDNWDQEGAKKVSTRDFEDAVLFAIKLSHFVSDKLDIKILPPYFQPCKDSIDLSFEEERISLLVNIKNGKYAYYGFSRDLPESYKKVEINELGNISEEIPDCFIPLFSLINAI